MGIPIISDIYDIYNTERNFAAQMENYRYQKELQQKIFEREDSSLQRRVADAEAAGLNPQLALGSGAGTGQAISTSAPQHEAPQIDFLNEAISLEKGIKELELLNSEKVGRDKQNSLLSLQEKREQSDFDYYTSRGLPSNANGQYVQILQALGSIVKGLKGDKPNKTTVGGIMEDLFPYDEDAPSPVDRAREELGDWDYNPVESVKNLSKKGAEKINSLKEAVGNWIKGKKERFSNYRKKRMETYDKKKKNIFGN